MRDFVAVFDKDSYKFLWGMPLSSKETARGYCLGVIDGSAHLPFILPDEHVQCIKAVGEIEFFAAMKAMNS